MGIYRTIQELWFIIRGRMTQESWIMILIRRMCSCRDVMNKKGINGGSLIWFRISESILEVGWLRSHGSLFLAFYLELKLIRVQVGIIGMIEEKCINFRGSMKWSCDSWFKLHLDKVLAGGSSQVFALWLRRLLNFVWLNWIFIENSISSGNPTHVWKLSLPLSLIHGLF